MTTPRIMSSFKTPGKPWIVVSGTLGHLAVWMDDWRIEMRTLDLPSHHFSMPDNMNDELKSRWLRAWSRNRIGIDYYSEVPGRAINDVYEEDGEFFLKKRREGVWLVSGNAVFHPAGLRFQLVQSVSLDQDLTPEIRAIPPFCVGDTE
jgi:hypothetical protein